MHDNKNKYLKILQIEIEDLQEDVNDLIEHYRKESEIGNISNYIYNENLVVFKKELLCLKMFFTILDSIDPDKYDTIDELIKFIRDSYEEKIKESGLIRATSTFIERKLTKVKKYVMHE